MKPTSAEATAGRPLVVMIHGRNAGPENILDLVPRLSRPQFDYVAPAAPNRTWYPFSFMAEFEQNEPHLSNALEQIPHHARSRAP